MEQNNAPSFEPNFDLDFDFDDYNAEPEIDAYNEPSPFEIPANPYVDTAATVPVRVDTRTPEERIADLFDQMATHRKTLEGVIGACTEPQPASELYAYIESLQETDFSVFSAASICAALERAGALVRLADETEAPAESEEGATPEADAAAHSEEATESAAATVVDEDGIEYLDIKPAAETQWQATAEGLAFVNAKDPMTAIKNLFETEASYLPIFKRALTMAAADGGTTLPKLEEAIDEDPLVQEPRFYAPYFAELLEQCDALEWRGGWHASSIGVQALELLADVADPASEQTTPAESEAAAE